MRCVHGLDGSREASPVHCAQWPKGSLMPACRVACILVLQRAFMFAGRPGCAVSLGLNGSARGKGPAMVWRRGRNTERRHR